MDIELGELKSVGDELIKFLEDKIGTKPIREGDILTIQEVEGHASIRTAFLKTYLKRFLHAKGMRKDTRISVERGTIRIYHKGGAKEEESKK